MAHIEKSGQRLEHHDGDPLIVLAGPMAANPECGPTGLIPVKKSAPAS